MVERILGWLRLRPGPVIEQIPPVEAPCPHGVPWDAECGPCTLAAIDAQLVEAVAAGDGVVADRLRAAWSRALARQLRRSTPGRTL